MKAFWLYLYTDSGKGFVQKIALVHRVDFKNIRGICKGLSRQWLSLFDTINGTGSRPFWRAYARNWDAMMSDAVRRHGGVTTQKYVSYAKDLDKCLEALLEPGRKRIGMNVLGGGHSIAAVVYSKTSGSLFDPTFGEYTIGKDHHYTTFEALFVDLWTYYETQFNFSVCVWDWQDSDVRQMEDPKESLLEWEMIDIPDANGSNNNNNNNNNTLTTATTSSHHSQGNDGKTDVEDFKSV